MYTDSLTEFQFLAACISRSIDPAFVSSPSGILFKEVFQSSSAPSTGVLLRLYMRGGSGEHRTQHETSTDQWRLHILEKELPSGKMSCLG